MTQLQGKNVFVSGGTRGIGAAIVKKFDKAAVSMAWCQEYARVSSSIRGG